MIGKLLAKHGIHVSKVRTMPLRKVALKKAIGFAAHFKNLPRGAVVECGVGKGISFIGLAYLAEQSDREIYGYDSFEGFPDPTPEDTSPRNPKKGEWRGTSKEDVIQYLKTADFDEAWIDSDVHLIEGFFDTTLKHYDGGSIAFLHLDVDMYRSYKDCFKYLAPYVVKGGIILFDEYNDPNWPGATQAIDEYLKETGRQLQHDAFLNRYFVTV